MVEIADELQLHFIQISVDFQVATVQKWQKVLIVPKPKSWSMVVASDSDLTKTGTSITLTSALKKQPQSTFTHQMPLVSIIIPCYNVGKIHMAPAFRGCLKSLRACVSLP
ncbi:MAG: hypothetical protein PUP91_20235 [Rhizonema sp. PD37]|nr:hypothetical protein [Rhizonema sp. PD37]